jgi:CheY-like chemotaxis protein
MFSLPDLTGKNIMMADDSELNRTVLLYLLEGTKANIFVAENGHEAVRLFMESETNFFDLISMNIQMPEMDGNKATFAIRHSGRIVFRGNF